MLIILGIKLPVCWEYMECMKMEYPSKLEAKIKYTLGGYSGAQMGSCGQTSLKRKISCKCAFEPRPHPHLRSRSQYCIVDAPRGEAGMGSLFGAGVLYLFLRRSEDDWFQALRVSIFLVSFLVVLGLHIQALKLYMYNVILCKCPN
jgi:hypothetical protein